MTLSHESKRKRCYFYTNLCLRSIPNKFNKSKGNNSTPKAYTLSVYPGRASYLQQSKWIRSLQVTERKEELLMSKNEYEAAQASRGTGSGIVRGQGARPLIQIPIPIIAPAASGGSLSPANNAGRGLTTRNQLPLFYTTT